MASKFFGATGVDGGSDGDLDNIDGGNLADNDGAFVIEQATNQVAAWVLDGDSGLTEVLPTIVAPDANAGTKRWLLRGVTVAGMKMYEPGTANLLQVSQSSGNVIFDNQFDTGIITFKGENTGDATMLVMDPAGGVDLYNEGSIAVGIGNGVLTLTESGSKSGTLTVEADGDIILAGKTNSRQIQLTALDSVAAVHTILQGWGDSNTNLFYDGIIAMSTTLSGIEVYDTDGSLAAITFRDSGDAVIGVVQSVSGSVQLLVGASGEKGLACNNDADVELYYDNDKVVSTTATGLTTMYANEWDKAQNFNQTSLSDGATIAWDVDDNQVTDVTITADRTMGGPTNLKAGGNYQLSVIQDGTGGWGLTWNAVFKWEGGTAPSLATGASERTIFTFLSDGTNLYGVAAWTEN